MDDLRTAYDLSGRVAVVTGAGSGIGRASAIALAAAGATVVCADLVAASAEETAKRIADGGGSASATPVDVSVRDQVFGLVEQAAADHGRVDVMANIAGIMHTSTVVETEEVDLDRVLAVNLKGVFFGCQAAGRVMAEQGSGSIVNMSSGAIDVPTSGIVCYAIAKSGVAQITKTLATELGPSGVRVNAVAPGFVISGMTGRHFTNPDGTVDEAKKDAISKQMGSMAALRRVGQPDDIAHSVLFLASDASSFMTGQIVRPNGGVAMPW